MFKNFNDSTTIDESRLDKIIAQFWKYSHILRKEVRSIDQAVYEDFDEHLQGIDDCLDELGLNESKTRQNRQTLKSRDRNIEKSAGQELNLGTKTIDSKKKYARKEKHKNQMKENLLSRKTQKNLETLAGVKQDDYTITERGLKFQFENSLQANQCQIIEYHDKVIFELRKKVDNLLEGTYDKLIFEDIIDIREFQEVFESKTGIYLSYLD